MLKNLKNHTPNNVFIRQITWLFIALIPLYYSAYIEREKRLTTNSEEFDVAMEEEIIREYFQYPNENIDLRSLSKSSSSSHPAILNKVQQEVDTFLKEKANGNNEEFLKDLACTAYVCLFFERTYQRISGSHIKLLEYLEFHLGRLVSEGEVHKIFQKNVPTSQNDRGVFSKWLKFLERSSFIHIQEGKIGLTNTGLEFLGYIKNRGYSLSRSG